MALIVTKVSEAFYTASVSPPNAPAPWNTDTPIRMHQLCDQLLALGLHQVDIGDAISEADRKWFEQTLEIRSRPKVGDNVILKECPLGLLDGLPVEDQRAILAIIGNPVRLNEYHDDGRAEVEFTDADGVIHFLYVSSDTIEAA